MRYHSLALDENSIPPVFEISARNDDDKEVMAMRHRQLPLEGVAISSRINYDRTWQNIVAKFFDRYLE